MKRPVDVLAELDLASERLFDAGLHRDLSLDVARDAVAELIDAVEDCGWIGSRVYEALANVRGVA